MTKMDKLVRSSFHKRQIQAAERAAGQVPDKAFAGAGTEMSKAAFIAIKDGKPLSAAKSLWR